MKKFNLLLSVLLFFNLCINAQKEDTIYVNMENNVYLFFSSPIKQGISGSESVIFVYNKENKEKIGILKGKPGSNTNLLIITDDGYIYSYLIMYKKNLAKFNYFINKNNSINSVNRENSKTENKEFYNNDAITENSYDTVSIYGKKKLESKNKLKTNCKSVINDGVFFKRFVNINSNVQLYLNNLEYKNNYYYFYVEIKNLTNVDYDINFFEFYLSTKKKKLRSAAQKIIYKPDYIYNNAKRIKGKGNQKYVFVIKKFTISDNKVLIFDVNELKGERNLSLEINSEIINNPN